MTARTYNELFEPALRLTLHRSDGGYYSVTDQNGRLFTPPSTNVAFHVKFMLAMAAKRDAVIDAASVEAFGHSVKVPQGSLAPGGFSQPAGRALSRRTEGARTPGAGVRDSSGECGADGVPSPDSNVIPIFRNHGEEIAAAVDGTHPRYAISDREALAAADQHDIQTRLK